MVFYNPGRTSDYPDTPVNSGYRYHYLGGGDEVGNVGVILEGQNDNRNSPRLRYSANFAT